MLFRQFFLLKTLHATCHIQELSDILFERINHLWHPVGKRSFHGNYRLSDPLKLPPRYPIGQRQGVLGA